ncbi:MAG: hypothetical protein RI947_1197 [Candidatus Parcubacteria bacterium]|jgi:sulfite exporter TauE/SafE/copper chaperone CopZ
MRVTKVPIKGMHCRSCELLIEDELSNLKGVEKVVANTQKGEALVHHQKKLAYSAVAHAVRKAGYDIGRDLPKPWFSRDGNAYIESGVMALILVLVFYITKDLGLLKAIEFGSNNFASLPVVFMVGLTAGISTCAALIGGLVLGTSARHAKQYPEATATDRFIPHLYFNAGRILSFFVLGGLIGFIGSFFQMSMGLLGILTIVVGLVMLFFGAQLTELFPRLSGVSITIPTAVAKMLGLKQQSEKAYSHKNAMVLGGLTFFLPCGFTQVMQLYAISTGSPLKAALVMSVFALGTTPGLLGIGGLTSVVKGAFAKSFFRFAGIIVIALALFNISNGMNLSGLQNGFTLSANTTELQTAPAANAQVIKTVYTTKSDIQPNAFTVKAGQPVRMEIDVKNDGFGCMGSFALPQLSKQVEMLVKGKTLVYEFTPTTPGTYNITCAMGVPRGTITVI